LVGVWSSAVGSSDLFFFFFLVYRSLLVLRVEQCESLFSASQGEFFIDGST